MSKVIACLFSMLEILLSLIEYSRQDVLLKNQKPQFSGPCDVQRSIENFGEANVKIELFTKAFVDHRPTSKIGRPNYTRVFSIIFKILTNQDLTFNYITETVTRYYPHWSFIDEMLFLLEDNIQSDRMLHFSLFGILRNGREKGIYQWDLKVLSAASICFRSLTRLFQIPMCDTIRDVDRFAMGDDLRLASGTSGIIPDHMIKELANWCTNVKG